MAYWIDHNSSYVPSGQKCFYCDDVDDIAKLPHMNVEGTDQVGSVTNNTCQPGSSCLCIGTSEVYILNSNDEWVSI